VAGTVAYLDLTEFKLVSVVPASFIDEVELRTPGWVDRRLLMASSFIDARLCKRYDAPFKLPYPLAVVEWCQRIVSVDVWLRRGVSATDQEFQEYKLQAVQAFADIREAADSAEGLFELPLRADTDDGAVARGFPRVHSEYSPYVWADEQAQLGRSEDQGLR